ncbi:hypothetical protein CAEBREN_04100 [Caenorhabditis brenneri]|uniref:Uncharacterized protein n=1 Tax=Caenorhabditis brenneri TaxID=135651 RepID=G0MWL2_CAEBE|nr:hypothetical protein CAEBREN_04100 [Caenorhabditis brenneri]
MYFMFTFSSLDYASDDPERVNGTRIRVFETIGPTITLILVQSVKPVFEDSHTSIWLLMGTAQSGFLANLMMILYENNEMVDLTYVRVATTVFGFYVLMKFVCFETILIPKFPLRIHWKSIILITTLFSSTAFYMYPYTPSWNLFYHFYIYLLCIEASIWYYTKEFRLYLRYPTPHGLLYLKAIYITVHRNVQTQQPSS